MDWLKLFALLVAVASINIKAEGAKKKIRIHLPQKVKHIHHHKKIYITNHPASSQYAPAYMPSAEGAVAVPTSVALPAVANLLSLNSVELYDDAQHRAPGVAAAGSKIVPLYRARGYYGPNPTEFDDQEYDLAPPPEPTDNSYLPTAFSDPLEAAAPNYPPKKVKIIKVNGELPRKKAPRKLKSKLQRVVPRAKPQPQDDEHPVTNFHEQFYSDLDGSGTIRKIRRPQRVEKIIDGDTEHIHTYSEEHIHKLIYDDGRVDSNIGSMSALAGHSHPFMRFKNPQTLVAYSPDALAALSAHGSMGTPSHLEYAAYNPREVTHDHIFHDHGEIPPDVDVTREQMSFPPRVSYNSQGIRVGGIEQKGYKKYGQKYNKPPKTSSTDYSYYESMYSPFSKPRNAPRPTKPTSFYGAPDQSLNDYSPIPSFQLKDKGKTRNGAALYFGNGKQVPDYGLHQASVPAPFAVSSTVVHDYKPKAYAGAALPKRPLAQNKYKDPLLNFKDNSYTNNLDFDSFAAPSNLYASEDNINNPTPIYHGKKGKKKSVSTQNISFGGLDHQTTVDHLGDSSLNFPVNDGSSLNVNAYNNFNLNQGIDSATSTPYTIRESSPAHPYYSAMALQALQSDPLSVGEASNDNFQYAEAPSTTTHTPSVATTTSPPPENYFLEIETTDPAPTEPTEYIIETRQRHRPKETSLSATSTHKDTRQKYSVLDLPQKDYKSADRPVVPTLTVLHHATKYSYKHDTDMPRSAGSLKYGDRI